jgi:hypothetical protein
MSQNGEFLVRVLSIGVGATLFMDLWAALLRRFGVRSLDFALLGRWIGSWPRGRWSHPDIARAAPVRGERALGWAAHYGIGVGFAALLLASVGLDWARAPSPLPALGIGLVTAAAPLLVLQPALGAGIASSKTPRPWFNASKSVVTHAVYGLGLYAAAWIGAELWAGA